MSGSSAGLKEAQASLEEGRYEEAIERLGSMREAGESEAFPYLARAFALRGQYLTVLSVYLDWAQWEAEQGCREKAEEALGYALSLQPDSLSAHRLGVEIARSHKDREKLVERLRELSALCLDKGLEEDSVSFLREAVECRPEDRELPLRLAEVYVATGQIETAVREYRKCSELFRERGDLESSISALRRLKMLRSDDVELLLELGRACLSADRVDEAEEQFRAVLRLDLESREGLLCLAEVCLRKGLLRNGTLALSKVLQLFPDCAEAHFGLGEFGRLSGDLSQAVEAYRRAGQRYLELGEESQGGLAFQKLLQLAPDDGEALDALSHLGLLPLSSEPELSNSLECAAPESESESEPELELKSASVSVRCQEFKRPALVKKEQFESSGEGVKPPLRRESLLPESSGQRPGLAPRRPGGSKPILPRREERVESSPPPLPVPELVSPELGEESVPKDNSLESPFDDILVEPELEPLDELPSFEEIFLKEELVKVEVEIEVEEEIEMGAEARARVDESEELPAFTFELGETLELDPDVLFPEEPDRLFPEEGSELFPDEPEVYLSEEDSEPEPRLLEKLPEEALEPPLLGPLTVEIPLPDPEFQKARELELQEMLASTIPLEPVGPETEGKEETFLEPERVEEVALDLPDLPELEEDDESQDLEEPVEFEAGDAGARVERLRGYLSEFPRDEEQLMLLGDLSLRHGLLKDALSRFRSLRKLRPGSLEVLRKLVKAALWSEDYGTVKEGLWELSELCFARGELAECQDTLGSLLSLEPEHTGAKELMIDLFEASGQHKLAAWHLSQAVERWMAEGAYDKAEGALERLYRWKPDLQLQERLARLHQTQGNPAAAALLFRELRSAYKRDEKWDEAVEAARMVVESESGELSDHEELLALYSERGLLEEADRERCRLALKLRERGELTRAVQLLEELLKERPQHSEARRLLVELYLQSDSLSLAEQQSEILAEQFLRDKCYQQGVELFECWVRRAPDHAKVREFLAQFYQLNGDLEGAKLEWLLVTEVLELQGDFGRAALALERALELAPEEREWRLRLARTRLGPLGEPESALAELRSLFSATPNWLPATRVYFELLLQERRFGELGACLKRVSESSEGAELRNSIALAITGEIEREPGDLELQFGWGELCYAFEELDSAIEVFQGLRRVEKYRLSSYRLLGCCFAKKSGPNMKELALNQFRKGLALPHQEPEEVGRLRLDMACLLEEMGRLSQAREECSQALNLLPGDARATELLRRLEGPAEER